MAQAIFKSWFVDFDPVRAKMNGESRESICKRLKLTPEILDLFPDRMVDSELGEIPERWVTGLLGSILNLRRERCNPSQETMDRPYVPIECISSKSLSLTESKPGSQAQSSLTKFYKYDILFGAMRPYFHKVCIAPFNGTTRTTAFVLYPKDVHDFAFGIFSVFSEDTINYATINSTGSTIPYAVWENSLENILIPMPRKEIRLAFNDAVGSMLLYITDNPYKQLTNLQIIRNTLLPKLISGEIRVPEAEHLIEETME
jgi:type I restriction enzyme S subunit